MKEFIKCPGCGGVELATVDTTTIPWNTYVHFCSCGYTIMESEWEPLKALSIKQPWAWLIMNGYKDIENRNNLKNFTGEFLIHASLKPHKFDLTNPTTSENLAINHILHENIDPMYGGIIGYATITGFVEKSDSPWFIGKYGLLIRDPKPLPFTPCKGKLSFFTPEIIPSA